MFNIYLSIQNRTEEIMIPVLPAAFEVSSEYGNERIDTVTHDEVLHIGNRKLTSISFSSFFPAKNYEFLRSRDRFGWEYISTIERWRAMKIPIRLIITGTTINIAASITSFEYKVQDGTGDIYYTLVFDEYRFVDIQKLKSVPLAKPKPPVEPPKPKSSPTSGKYSNKSSANAKKNADTISRKGVTAGYKSLSQREAEKKSIRDERAAGNRQKPDDNLLTNAYKKQKEALEAKAGYLTTNAKQQNDLEAKMKLSADEKKRYDEFDSRGAFYPTWAK